MSLVFVTLSSPFFEGRVDRAAYTRKGLRRYLKTLDTNSKIRIAYAMDLCLLVPDELLESKHNITFYLEDHKYYLRNDERQRSYTHKELAKDIWSRVTGSAI